MAKTSSKNTDDIAKMLKGRYDSAVEVQQPFLPQWDAHERLFMARQATTKTQSDSRIYEGGLTTNVVERAIRTTAQLPTGTFRKKGLDDTDMGFLVGLLFDNHTIPNCTQQHDALTKIRLTGIYKHLYGSQASRVGYVLRDGKIYADFRLAEARSLLKQPNRYSIKDMEWIMESSVVSVGTLETWLEDKTGTWNKPNLRKLIESKTKGASAASLNDGRKMSVNQQVSQRPSETGSGATVDVYQCYERGKKGQFYTFVLESIKGAKGQTNQFVSVLRTSANFMPDGSLPYPENHSVPLIDRAYGLGDFERNKTIQTAIDSGASLGMSALALKTLPPVVFPTQGVVESTIRLAPQAQWRSDNPEKIVAMNLAPDAIPAYQSMNSTLHAFLMNNQGSTDMQVPTGDSGMPAQGKTPAAINKQGNRQDTKDAWDVEMNEAYVSDLFTKLINVQCNVITKPVTFWVFDADVVRLQSSKVPTKLYKVSKSGKSAEITVAPKDIKGEYFFDLEKGSAFAKNIADEQDALKEIYADVTSSPIAVQLLQAEGTQVKLGEILQHRLTAAGMKDADKIVITQEQTTEGQPQNDQQQPAPQAMPPEQDAAQHMQQPQQIDAFGALANHPDPQVQALAQLHAQQLQQALQGGQQ